MALTHRLELMSSHGKLITVLLSSILLLPAVCSDECVTVLPENVGHLMLQRTALTLEHHQLRLFPNITFNCDGSIVGWSMIAPQHTARGGRTELSVWTQISESGTFRKTSSALLTPCIRTEISAEDNMYLHENVLEEPVEFHSGNILGMLLRPERIARFPPYFMSKESFVSTFREAGSSQANDTESTSGTSDDKLPLISLVICTRGDEADYQRCVAENSKARTCGERSTPSSGSSKSETLSPGQLTAAVVIPLGLAVLALMAVMVSVLAYVCVRRRRSRRGKSVVTVTDQDEPQPYAEPIVKSMISSSPLPTPRSQTPLPPIPGLRPQPLYSVLDGPSPSPPPPYSIELDQQKTARNTLQSPEYESIDGFSKTGLPRQNAIDGGVHCGKGVMVNGGEGSGGIGSSKYKNEEK